MSGIKFDIRKATESEYPLILSSWKRMMFSSSNYSWVKQGVFFGTMNRRCDGILYNIGALVACSSETPELILGWSCSDRDLLHFVYVKELYRRNRIASALLQDAGLDPIERGVKVTHWTDVCERLPWRLDYVPSKLKWKPHYGTAQDRAQGTSEPTRAPRSA